MDVNNPRHSKEYRALRAILEKMGYYEDGMELGKMRELIAVLPFSSNGNRASGSQSDGRQPLTESGFAAVPPQSSPVFNSTIMSPNRNVTHNISTDSLVPSDKPETDGLSRKRSAAVSAESDIPSTVPRIEQRDIPSTSLVAETCTEQTQSFSSHSSYWTVLYKNLGDTDSNKTSQGVDSLESSTEDYTRNLFDTRNLLSEQTEGSSSQKDSTVPSIEQTDIPNTSLDAETCNEQTQSFSSRSSYWTVLYKNLGDTDSNKTSQGVDSLESSAEAYISNLFETRNLLSEQAEDSSSQKGSTVPRIEQTDIPSTSLDAKPYNEQIQSVSRRSPYLAMLYKNLADTDSNNTSMDVDSLESSTEASISNLLEVRNLLSEEGKDRLLQKRSSLPSTSLDVVICNEQLQSDSRRSSYFKVLNAKLRNTDSNNTLLDVDSLPSEQTSVSKKRSSLPRIEQTDINILDRNLGGTDSKNTLQDIDNLFSEKANVSQKRPSLPIIKQTDIPRTRNEQLQSDIRRSSCFDVLDKKLGDTDSKNTLQDVDSLFSEQASVSQKRSSLPIIEQTDIPSTRNEQLQSDIRRASGFNVLDKKLGDTDSKNTLQDVDSLFSEQASVPQIRSSLPIIEPTDIPSTSLDMEMRNEQFQSDIPSSYFKVLNTKCGNTDLSNTLQDVESLFSEQASVSHKRSSLPRIEQTDIKVLVKKLGDTDSENTLQDVDSLFSEQASASQKRSSLPIIEPTDIPSTPLDVEICNEQLQSDIRRSFYLNVLHTQLGDADSSNTLQDVDSIFSEQAEDNVSQNLSTVPVIEQTHSHVSEHKKTLDSSCFEECQTPQATSSRIDNMVEDSISSLENAAELAEYKNEPNQDTAN